MKSLRTAGPLAAGLLAACVTHATAAATLTSAYEFNGNFHDAVIEGHDNDMVTGTRNLGSGTVTASSFVFGPNQGVSLGNALVNTGNYSIELYFAFDPASSGSLYRSIFDPGDTRSDFNLYARESQRVQFYDAAVSDPAPVLSTSQKSHLIFTRASDGNLTAFIDGVRVLNVTLNPSRVADSAATGNVVHFFEDDSGEAAAGEVDYIRLYDGIIDQTQASQLYAARNNALSTVPVPGALPLLLSGLLGLGWRRRA